MEYPWFAKTYGESPVPQEPAHEPRDPWKPAIHIHPSRQIANESFFAPGAQAAEGRDKSVEFMRVVSPKKQKKRRSNRSKSQSPRRISRSDRRSRSVEKNQSPSAEKRRRSPDRTARRSRSRERRSVSGGRRRSRKSKSPEKSRDDRQKSSKDRK